MEITEAIIKKWINEKFNSFTKRLGDTPTDSLQLVPLKYLNTPAAISGTNDDGGQLKITLGKGDGAGQGGTVEFISGNGGATGPGGTVFLIGGSGGATSGNGGQVNLSSGSALNNSNGGNINLTPGSGAGTGHQGDIVLYGSDINTTANGGFVVLPTMQGAPTGTPTLNGSMVYDRTNNKLYVYNGSWRSTTLT